MAKGTYVFDIDGTLADYRHRQHYLYGETRDWDSFFAAQPLDTVHVCIATILRLAWQADFDIILLTGRGEEYRLETAQWLINHNIPFNRLIMRPAGSRECDSTLKVNLLEKHLTQEERDSILTIFEDRKRVVEGLRGAGYHVCSVAEGDF